MQRSLLDFQIATMLVVGGRRRANAFVYSLVGTNIATCLLDRLRVRLFDGCGSVLAPLWIARARMVAGFVRKATHRQRVGQSSRFYKQ